MDARTLDDDAVAGLKSTGQRKGSLGAAIVLFVSVEVSKQEVPVISPIAISAGIG